MMDYDIADYLADNGLGTLGTDTFAGYMPDSTGTTVAVYQGMGYVPVLPTTIERPELRIVCRAADIDTAMNKVNDIYAFLHKKSEVTLNGVRYLFIRALGSPALLRADYTHDPPQFFAYITFAVHKESE